MAYIKVGKKVLYWFLKKQSKFSQGNVTTFVVNT